MYSALSPVIAGYMLQLKVCSTTAEAWSHKIPQIKILFALHVSHYEQKEISWEAFKIYTHNVST